MTDQTPDPWEAIERDILLRHCTSYTVDAIRAARALDAQRLQQAQQEIAALKAALNNIASWGEGPIVNACFDEPAAAQKARNALTPKAQYDE